MPYKTKAAKAARDKAANASPIRRKINTGVHVAVDEEKTKQILLLCKQNNEQNQVLISKQHNTQVELSGLKANLNGLLAAILTCFDKPSSVGEVEAVLRDFLFQKHKNDKPR